MTYRAWRSARDWVFLADVTEDLRRHVVSRWITTFVRTGSTWRRSYAEHRVGLFSRSSVLRELRARGFAARTLRGYGAAPLGPRRFVFHAAGRRLNRWPWAG